MDKTIEVLLVAMIAVIAAVIIVAMMTGQTDEFSGFLDTERQGAECSLAQTQIENCRAEPEDYSDLDCEFDMDSVYAEAGCESQNQEG